MPDPLVSVKMITYNHAPYIAEAIEGVLQQKTNFPFEIVIGEDCSTDGTREIVFEYEKKYPDIIRVITSDKNVGMKKNGLRTTKACRGKYVAFCEGDDSWHNPDKMQKQANYMEDHPECGLVYSSYDVYHVASKKRINDFIRYRKLDFIREPSLADIVEGKNGIGLGILTCTIMIRRSLHMQIIESDPYLHQSTHFLMGDTQLWAEIAAMARFHYIPESLATHNITAESATRSKDIRKELRFQISGSELSLYLSNKYNLPSRIRNIHEKSWCDSSLRLAFYNRNAELAEDVRRRKEAFNGREWLRYYGAKSLIFHYTYRSASLLFNIFRKERNQWL